jgi:hypothetical protein
MKRNRSLSLLWGWDRKAFALRCYHAAIKRDWKFLLKAGEALKPQPQPVNYPLHSRVLAAYEDLYHQHGWKKTTKQLIRRTVDPTIPLQDYSRAFKKAGLQDIPEGKRGRKPKLIITTKDF